MYTLLLLTWKSVDSVRLPEFSKVRVRKKKKKKKKNRKLLFDMFSIVLSLDQVSHNRIILLLLYAAHVMKFVMYSPTRYNLVTY